MSEPFVALQFVIVSGLLMALTVALVLSLVQRPLLAALRREAPLRRVRFGRALLLAPAAFGLFYALLIVVVPRWLAAVPAVRYACYSHEDALWHACFAHPTGSGASLEVWTALGLAGLAALVLLAIWSWRLLRDLRLLRSLLRLATPAPKRAEVHVVEVDAPLALACGLRRGRILVSRFLLERLPARQIEVIVAHEADHLRHHDLVWRLLVRVAAWLHGPALRRALLADLELATEQRCDLAAVRAVGSPLEVAETLFAVESLMRSRATGSAATAAFGEQFVAERIEALLQPPPPATRTPRVLVVLLLLASSLASVAWIHAVAEHLIIGLMP